MKDKELLEIYEKSVKQLRECTGIQSNSGNWNYDPYMHGMANGMIFALSLFDNKRPEYLEAPEYWLKNMADSEHKSVEESSNEQGD